MKIYLMLICISLLSLSACANKPSPNTSSQSHKAPINQCNDPRPQICTQEYRIVCATLADGSQQEYSNGCTACTDTKVVQWLDGACVK